ncbi:hypothetical protein BAUCODRAFT_379459 [Baudoinia panamericana UAMH 10762]|uniref:Protein artemis n=1 Tax=Baudoinia panamericana (strain UAMH 10762) TaxID=717646 RepID=M2MPQ5_BAUPA|nr:uncharacterized protein BAUCODRAFT_379459 [Baudoinia panamericana UAMH 10762]EMC98741.1 hypothetical protein BAUCODRAFT_379459 [Baudoinia panamericana UAMH 10762]
MSTFDGVVKEFPDIRIDCFTQPGALACFLSHVHSDHLRGLESFRSPFIYCSPATRDILLRLEKYPHRMNFAKGILESRKQTYKHLAKLLKPIPLETPTTIELTPGNSIRVTLFNANHCVGAVCFLIEGSGKAIFYSGDVRAENWWVNLLIRNPFIIPYVPSPTHGGPPLKQLDCIYLDTTFAVKDEPYKQFPSKAEGLSELLLAVSKYPKDTVYYFDAWTFGYEEVWLALSSFLDSQVHVDDYRYGLYRAVANSQETKAAEAPKLMGFHCGNHFQKGCLTLQSARLHSCERGTGCEVWQKDYVRITPIISRHDGVEILEVGAGGGLGDISAHHELEVFDAALVGQLIALCAIKLQGQPQLLAKVTDMLSHLISQRATSISLDKSGFINDCLGAPEHGEDRYGEAEELPLERLVPALAKLVTKRALSRDGGSPVNKSGVTGPRPDGLPRQVTFPYSRHSSYNELCELVDAFNPKDIHPCTVDEAHWTAANSMAFLFGHLYHHLPSFSHDQQMFKKRKLEPMSADIVSSRQQSGSRNGSRAKADELEEDHDGSRQIPALDRPLDHITWSGSPATEHRDESFENMPSDTLAISTSGVGSPNNPQHDPFREGLHKASFPGRHEDPPRQAKRQKVAKGSIECGRLSPPSAQTRSRSDGARSASPAVDATDDMKVLELPQKLYEHAAQSAPSAQRGRTAAMYLPKGRLPGDWLHERLQTHQRRQHAGDASGDGHSSVTEVAKQIKRRPKISSVATDERVSPQHDMHYNPPSQRPPSRLSRTGQDQRKPKLESTETLPEASRIARRQKAFSAALNEDGADWSSISLVSTWGGHQVREEEL